MQKKGGLGSSAASGQDQSSNELVFVVETC
jgi:hypothetical protein